MHIYIYIIYDVIYDTSELYKYNESTAQRKCSIIKNVLLNTVLYKRLSNFLRAWHTDGQTDLSTLKHRPLQNSMFMQNNLLCQAFHEVSIICYTLYRCSLLILNKIVRPNTQYCWAVPCIRNHARPRSKSIPKISALKVEVPAQLSA